MNKSPMNYLITLSGGAILWVITAIVLGGVIGDRITLASMSTDDFLARYRIILAIAAVCGILNAIYWYFYGGKDSTAGELNKAKRIWHALFLTQIITAVVILFILVFMLMAEGVAPLHYAIFFALISLHTYIYFWLCTFFMSPINVERIPLFK